MGFGDACEAASISAAEGPSGSRQNELFDRVVLFTCQTLENGTVFAVHREDVYALFSGCTHYNFSGDNKGFLIGESDVFAGCDGVHCGLKSGEAHQGSEDDINPFGFYELGDGVWP